MKAHNQRGALLVKPDISELEEQQEQEHLTVKELLMAILLELRKQSLRFEEWDGEKVSDEDVKGGI